MIPMFNQDVWCLCLNWSSVPVPIILYYMYSKNFPQRKVQIVTVVFAYLSNAFHFSSDDTVLGIELESPQRNAFTKKTKTKRGQRIKPWIELHSQVYFLCEFVCFFAWLFFGNILEILITAQIICMVSNGPVI